MPESMRWIDVELAALARSKKELVEALNRGGFKVTYSQLIAWSNGFSAPIFGFETACRRALEQMKTQQATAAQS